MSKKQINEKETARCAIQTPRDKPQKKQLKGSRWLFLEITQCWGGVGKV